MFTFHFNQSYVFKKYSIYLYFLDYPADNITFAEDTNGKMTLTCTICCGRKSSFWKSMILHSGETAPIIYKRRNPQWSPLPYRLVHIYSVSGLAVTKILGGQYSFTLTKWHGHQNYFFIAKAVLKEWRYTFLFCFKYNFPLKNPALN